METLIKFIVRNLSEDNMIFNYDSGRPASAMNKAQMMQIALELKNILNHKTELQTKEWKDFQLRIFNKQEELWTKKLEDYGKDDDKYFEDEELEAHEIIEIQLDPYVQYNQQEEDKKEDDDDEESLV